MKRLPVSRLLACCLVALCLITCAKVPYTNRTQLNLISPKQDAALGAKFAEVVLSKTVLSEDAALKAQVERVGGRIAAVADLPDADWRFYVIQNEIPNAFCLPGGKVFVFTGLFKIVENDEQLATVLGHEVGHVIARHGAEKRSQAILAGTIGGIAAGTVGAATQNPNAARGVHGLYGAMAKIGYLLPASRTCEYEADRIGLILMAKAGYDPEQALGFWRNMIRYSAQTKHKGPPTLFSTHPADADRAANLEKLLPEARSYAGATAKTNWGDIAPAAAEGVDSFN